jgi:tetratricopeptide (TPR) repeat protein
MAVDFPESLFDRLRTGNVILCSGVRFASAGALPNWPELLDKMHERVGSQEESLQTLLERGSMLTAAGCLKRRLGDESVAEVLTEAFGKSNGELPRTHQLLGDLPFFAAVNTGYDPLLERALAQGGDKPKVYSYADGAVLRISEDLKNFVVKAHGDPARAEKLVFTRMDYRRLIGTNRAYQSFVENLYRTHTLLLLGYRVGDPDFILFLDRLVATFGEPVSDHYAILADVSEAEVEELYANYRLRVITYDEGKDAGKNLADVLADFGKAWKAKGATVAELHDPVHWLQQQLAPVPQRIDVVGGEGLNITEGRLIRIGEVADEVDLGKLDAATLCRLGNVRLYLDDTVSAIRCYEMALAADGKCADAHLNLHHAKAETRSYGEALEHLNKAVELDDTMRIVPKRYELRSVIGRGTTGTVYHAQDQQEKRDVTVKVLRTSYVREHVSPERWLKEVQVLKKLKHDNIAKVYDALLEGGRCILITESLSGRSVHRMLKDDGAITPERAVEILSPVCEALTYAHGEGVVHLDVMPSNLFLRDGGKIALMDFRTGRAQKGRHVTVKKGSEGFQAPELLAGTGGNERTDVYSLGATLYYMMTGHVPVGSFPRLGEAKPSAKRFDRLVGRSMRAVPEERPQSTEEFNKHLIGSGEEIALPDNEDDLMGWIEVYTFQPDNLRAKEVLGKLEAGYRDAKDWENLIALLLSQVEAEPSRDGRVRKLRELARIFETEVGDIAKAFHILQTAFREDNDNVEVRQDLERLAAATSNWNDVLQEYGNVAQRQRDPKIACDWWVRLGKLYAKTGHDNHASTALSQALALDGNRIDAISELSDVVQRLGDYKEYARLLTKHVDLEKNGARKLELLREQARVYRKELDDEEKATELYRKVIALDPADEEAVASLEKSYRADSRWNDLATLFDRCISHTELEEEKGRYRHALADLYADELDEPHRAISQYESLLKLNGDDMRALKGLERLYDAAGHHEDYLKVLDQRISSAGSDQEKIAIYRRLAKEWESQGGGLAKTAEYLEKIDELGGATDETNKTLVRVYWELHDFDKLVAAYQRQIERAERPQEKAGILAAMGKVYEEHLKDTEKASEIYAQLSDLEKDNIIALAGLSRIYETTENWAQAEGVLLKLVKLEADPLKQVDYYARLGRLNVDELGNETVAEEYLVKALELRDDHAEAQITLGEIYRNRKDFAKSGRLLFDAAKNTPNKLEQVQRLFDAAQIFHKEVDDAAKTIEVLEALLEADPEHVQGGQDLVALYQKTGEQEKAKPILEMLVRKSEGMNRKDLLALQLGLGNACLALDEKEKATAAFREAYKADPASFEAVSNLAHLLFEQDEREEAGKLYQAMLVRGRDDLPKDEIVKLYLRLGDIKEGLGDKSKALNMFEKALDADHSNREALTRVVDAYADKGDFDAVARCKKNLLKLSDRESQRALLLEELGDLAADKLKRPNEAIGYYSDSAKVIEQAGEEELAKEVAKEDAAGKAPSLRRVYFKLLDVYTGQKKWADAVEVIKKLEAIETQPAQVYRLHHAAAIIYRDELKDSKEAVKHLDLALQADPTNMKAFNKLENVCVQQGNYKLLATAYRRMLKRLPEDTPVDEQVRLWHELGRMSQDELHDAKGAIVAFEVAAKLDPADVARQENLGRLYATAGPDAYGKAIAVNQRLLRHNPTRKEAYKELRRLYSEEGAHDKAWCVAAVLTALNAASPEEKKLYNDHKPKDKLRKVSRNLSDDLWRDYLYHPWQSSILSDVFAATAPLVVPMAVKTRGSHGLKSTEQLTPDDDKRGYAEVLNYAQRVVNRSPSEFFVHEGLPSRASLVMVGDENLQTSMLWIAPKLLNRSEAAMAFCFTRALARMRPEFLLSAVAPAPTVMRAVVLACLKVVDPGASIVGDLEEVNRLANIFRARLPAEQLEKLGGRLSELHEAAQDGAVERWLKGAELSANQAGLLVSNNLEIAAKLVATPSDAGSKERLAQLLVYAVSEEYFKAREVVGLNIS